ncbi:ACP S-malonyltransferase [Ruminococcus sp. HUN007]|uniref:ACP S-malonyltransferase n=1 Tax=Ruminococcus sp. HUN007 TaxID=1514668 RepID=UPI0005D2BF62|nr:ACP S-malonyltransferase [Ruminococcus sp. HUN007]
MAGDTETKNVFLFQGIGCNLDRLIKALSEEESEMLNTICAEASEYAKTDLLKYLNYRKEDTETTDVFSEWLVASLTDVAVFRTYQKKGITPDYIVGYSLGLNNAMHCAGSISLEACVNILKSGIECREEASRNGQSKYEMAAVIGLEEDVITDLIRRYSSDEKVKIASINTEFMMVLSGEKEEIQIILDKAMEEGALKAFLLGVGIPFHTSMMKDYSSCYFNAINNVRYGDAVYPIVSIYSQKKLITAEEMHIEMSRNVLEEMKWKGTIEYLESIGVRDFYDMSATEANRKASTLGNKGSRFITIKTLKKNGGF